MPRADASGNIGVEQSQGSCPIDGDRSDCSGADCARNSSKATPGESLSLMVGKEKLDYTEHFFEAHAKNFPRKAGFHGTTRDASHSKYP